MSKQVFCRMDSSRLFKSMEDDQYYIIIDEGEGDRMDKIEQKFLNERIPDSYKITCFLVGRVDEDDKYVYWDIISDNLFSLKINQLRSIGVWGIDKIN